MKNLDIKKFLSSDNVNVQEAKSAVFGPFYVYRNCMRMSQIYPSGFRKIVGIHKDKYLRQYLHQGDMDSFMEALKTEYLEDKGKFLERYGKWLESKEKLASACKSINLTELEKFDIEETWKRYAEFSNVFSDFWVFAAVGEEKGIYTENHIVPHFMEKWGMSKEETKDALSVLLNPDSVSVFTQEKIDFLSLCLNSQDKDASLAYLSKYFWKKTNFIESVPYLMADLKSEIESELAKREASDIEIELDGIEKEIVRSKGQRADLEERFMKDEYDRKLIEFLRLMVRLGEERKEAMMAGFYYLFGMIKIMAHKIGANYDDMTYLTSDEELKTFIGSDKSLVDEIEKRKYGMLFVFEEGRDEPAVMYGDELREIEEVIFDDSSIELKGNVASRGGMECIEGVARIVNDPEKDEFNDGEILVTSMTRVDFVPLMKKAKAIITNEGGLTCHAAIVSRELRMPCVIGTRSATTAIRNGQSVKIDLVSGLILIKQ